jgi:hypothetical protein
MLCTVACATSTPSEPTQPPMARASLEGTSWQIQIIDQGEEENYQLTFAANGVLQTNHPRDTTPDNDRWTATDDGVSFSFNDSYAQYTARITGDGTMEGEGSNVADAQWKFRLTPLE